LGLSNFSIIVITRWRKCTKKQQSNPAKRVRECFGFNWQFHKGDIAIKRAVRVGQDESANVNVQVITKEDTAVDYTDVKSAKVLKPGDWKKVNLPHDWCAEGTFVHDNSLGSQPAGSGYLPTGIGFYRKEFELPETDKGRKISIEFDGIYINSDVWINGVISATDPTGITVPTGLPGPGSANL